jgi:hypothetical protein
MCVVTDKNFKIPPLFESDFGQPANFLPTRSQSQTFRAKFVAKNLTVSISLVRLSRTLRSLPHPLDLHFFLNKNIPIPIHLLSIRSQISSSQLPALDPGLLLALTGAAPRRSPQPIPRCRNAGPPPRATLAVAWIVGLAASSRQHRRCSSLGGVPNDLGLFLDSRVASTSRPTSAVTGPPPRQLGISILVSSLLPSNRQPLDHQRRLLTERRRPRVYARAV